MLSLLRHTKPEIKPNICYGWADIGLDSFSEEADIERVLSKLEGREFSRIYTSPLSRCRILAERIAKKYNYDLVESALLKEINFGEWELRSWDDIYNSDEGRLWFENFLYNRCPNGESFLDLENRMRIFHKNIKEENILIVTHAGPMRAMLSLLGIYEREKVFERKIEYGELIEISPRNILNK